MSHAVMSSILPILIIDLVLLVIALVDCARVRKTRGPKWIWFLVIILFGLIGPIVYFIFGRDNR